MTEHATPAVPLQLSLEPLLSTRTPGSDRTFEYGFRLRFPGGPAIDRGDPLLDAYGAQVTCVVIEEEDGEQAQAASFDPGTFVRLVHEPAEDGDVDVAVWDREGLHRAGGLFDRASGIAGAAIECGLAQSAVVLNEDRTPADDRREGLELLVFHPGFLTLDTSAAAGFRRPDRATRQRLVLVADGTGDVRWWDPAASAGPINADELPMSAELTSAMQQLRAAYAQLREEDDSERRGFERFEAALDRHALDEQAAALWRRARAELGRRFAIGFLGAGMERPVWSPSELRDEDSDCPF